MDDLTGRVLCEKYRIERVIGSGGMGVVVMATHLRMSQPVAIKLLRADASHREDFVRRFAREARAASKLRGEHAVRILDVDESDAGEPFLVMEYLEGADLQRILADEGPLPLERAVEWLLQVCEGVAEAHAAGIVHRDLKPANLFVTKRPDGSALIKLLDFGISKIEDPAQDHGLTRPQTAIGSPSYMAPEQIRNAADADARTDVWALGVVFFQMLTNVLPFVGETTAALSLRIAVDPPTSLVTQRPDLSNEVEELIARCLAKNPGERFASVADFAESLAHLTDGAGPAASRVKRVLDARPPKEATATAPAKEPSQRSASGPLTQSIVESARLPPLAGAIITEYASAVGSTQAPVPPPRRAFWRRAFVGGASLLLASAIVVLVAGRMRRVSTTEHVPDAPSVPSAPPKEETKAPIPPTPETASASASASARIDAGIVRPSMRPAAPPSPTTRNPMDLDFR